MRAGTRHEFYAGGYLVNIRRKSFWRYFLSTDTVLFGVKFFVQEDYS